MGKYGWVGGRGLPLDHERAGCCARHVSFDSASSPSTLLTPTHLLDLLRHTNESCMWLAVIPPPTHTHTHPHTPCPRPPTPHPPPTPGTSTCQHVGSIGASAASSLMTWTVPGHRTMSMTLCEEWQMASSPGTCVAAVHSVWVFLGGGRGGGTRGTLLLSCFCVQCGTSILPRQA